MLTPQTAQQIRIAALEAIKSVPHAALGEGQINEIIAQAGSGDLSMSERLTRAASMAISAVSDYASKPINFSAATQQEVERMRAAMGLLPLSHHRGSMRLASNSGAAGGDDVSLSSRGGNEFNTLRTAARSGMCARGMAPASAFSIPSTVMWLASRKRRSRRQRTS